MGPRIAVIGAGPMGLMATKNLLDGGFDDITCYEARQYVGGLWNCSDDDAISVAEGTRFNNSRFRSAISDFPFPEDTDDFPTWTQMFRYLESYAEHFHLRKHIQLNTRVTRLSRVGEKWVVEVAPKDGEIRHERFDKVIVAVGTFHTPKVPKIPGIEKFTGTTVHSVHFNRHQEEFRDKRVLIIGLHASTQDVVMALKNHGAAQVYATHRNGVALLPRYGADGAPFDVGLSVNLMRLMLLLSASLPRVLSWLADLSIARSSRRAYPDAPASWALSPAPSMETTNPLIADDLYPLMASGFCEPVPAAARVLGPRSVELRGGRVLDGVDAVVYCTGYDLAAPFVEPAHQPYAVPGGPSSLYRGAFPMHPDPAVRGSLAFLGHGFVNLPGYVQLELGAMAVVQVWRGASRLPPLAEMERWHRGWLAWRADLLRRQKSEATFYVGAMPLADHLRWYDQAAGTEVFSHFGMLSRKAWSFWWSDRALYNQCATGCFSPAVWRLFETGKRKAWDGAREQIFEDDLAAKRATQRQLEVVRLAENKKIR